MRNKKIFMLYRLYRFGVSTNRNKNENRLFLRFHTRLLFTDEQYAYRNSMKHLLDMSMNSNKETAQNHKNLVVEFS